jgi:phosphatidate cytidylyltransferase
LAAVWAGSWVFVGLAALAGSLLAWEWNRLCRGRFDIVGKFMAAAAVAAVVIAHLAPVAALAVLLLAAVAAPFLDGRTLRRSWLWTTGGLLYVGLPALTMVWLRDQGRDLLLWLLFVVWATDIGAYAAGRTIGGPKLWPRVSPKKTWAGLVGGMASAATVGACVGAASDLPPVSLALLSGFLAVVAQAGDLAESWVKRHFGVKDSSAIIPGHGGVLDRLDGLLAAAPVVAVLCLVNGGGFSQWR